jgi:hypothetical protein
VDLTNNQEYRIITLYSHRRIDLEIFTFLGVVWAGWMLIKIIVTRVDIAQQHEKLKGQIGERIRVVELERLEDQGNILLAYDQENNRFLGQAQDVDGVKATLMARFPDQIFILNGEPFSALETINK